MTASTVSPVPPGVIIGAGTHSDVHVAAAVDELGRRLSTESFHAGLDGYTALESWATRLGAVSAFGIEGTGSWGAGLARHPRRGAIT